MLAEKPEGKLLGRSAQSGLDQTKIQIELAAAIKNGVQPRREVPKHGVTCPESLISPQSGVRMSGTAFHLGNIGLYNMVIHVCEISQLLLVTPCQNISYLWTIL